MNKKDFILAQKTITARQVKNEKNLINSYLETAKKNVRNGNSLKPNNGGSINLSASMEYSQVRDELPDLSHTFSRSMNTGTMGPPQTKQLSTLSSHNSHLVNELAQRATTAQTGLRKMNSDVAKTLQRSATKLPPASPDGHNRSFNSLPSHSPSPSAVPDVEFNDNYFMPKVTKFRSDGATLSEIYQSKQEDTWSKILKAQLKEEEEQKIRDRAAKHRADEHFGNLLKKQIAGNQAVIAGDNKANTVFAALEDATAKRQEDMQKKRTEDAINRHKKFISNAVEDIATKKERREREMLEEITASAIMINKAKQLIALDEQKKADEKAFHKARQEALFQENVVNLERKQRERLKQFSEDKRIIAENDRQFLREQKRREDALQSKLKRGSEGPAHHIVEHIVQAKRDKEEQFYEQLFKTDNGLNKQLKASEDAAHLRSKSNGDELTDEWVKNTRIKEQKKREDDERNNKILQQMHALLKRQELEDIAKKERQRQAALKYQRDLDHQLNTLRQKSKDALQKTMSEQEIQLNMGLIRKTAVVL